MVLTDYEKMLPNENALIMYWLQEGRISCSDIIQAYTNILNIEKLKLMGLLNQADMYTSVLIDGNKEIMEYQRPRAIEYILKNKRFEGSQWYNDLKKKYDKE